MITANDLRKLTSRPERSEKTVLTLYLDVDQSNQANLNRGFERQLKDMLATVRDAIHDDSEMKAFGIASQRVKDFVAQYQVAAHGLALVFDVADGFFWDQGIEFPIRNQIRWNREVFVGPLGSAIDTHEAVGIVLLDRANLRLFSIFLGEVEEHTQEEFNHRKVRHIKTVGMDHMGSASHVQRKADEQIRLNLRHVAKDMDLMLEQRGIRRIILAGSQEVITQLRAALPKRLAARVIGTVDLSSKATIEEVRSAVVPLAEKYERDTEDALVTDLMTSAAKADGAVIGLSHTLSALNQRRVWKFVYADGFQSPGSECPACAALFAVETPSCSLCGSGLVHVDDVIERSVDHAVRRGARIEVIQSEEAESSLMKEGGIGAFLKTRTGTVLAS